MNDAKFEAKNNHAVDQYLQPMFAGTNTTSQAFKFGLATYSY